MRFVPTHAMHYALKANSTLAVARLVRGLRHRRGSNSGGEIDVALRAGFIPEQIVFTGVGKTTRNCLRHIDLGISSSIQNRKGSSSRSICWRASDRRARAVALRVNPEMDPAATARLNRPEGERVGIPGRHSRSIPSLGRARPRDGHFARARGLRRSPISILSGAPPPPSWSSRGSRGTTRIAMNHLGSRRRPWRVTTTDRRCRPPKM